MASTQTDEGDRSIPWESPVLRVVLLSTLLAPLGVPLISPALPVIRDGLGLTDVQASVLISGYFLTGIVLSPVIGLLTDRLGRRRVLVPSLFVFAITGATIAVAPPFAVVLAIRIVQGTAAAGIFIATVTLIGDAFAGNRRNVVLGTNTAVLSIGAAIFPLLGGALAEIAWNVPFVAYLAGLPVAALAAVGLPETGGDRDVGGRTYVRDVLSTVTLREGTILYGGTFLIEFLLFGAIITALPFLLFAAYDLSALEIGLVLTATEVASAVAATQNGRVARSLSNHGIIAVGFVSAGIGLLGAWLAPSAVLTGVAAAVVGVGWGLTLPSVDDAMTDLVPARSRAGALSLRNSTTFLGRAAGPYLFASLALVTGYRRLLLGAGVLALVAAIVVFGLARQAP